MSSSSVGMRVFKGGRHEAGLVGQRDSKPAADGLKTPVNWSLESSPEFSRPLEAARSGHESA